MQVLGKPTAASLAVKHVQRNMKNWFGSQQVG